MMIILPRILTIQDTILKIKIGSLQNTNLMVISLKQEKLKAV